MNYNLCHDEMRHTLRQNDTIVRQDDLLLTLLHIRIAKSRVL